MQGEKKNVKVQKQDRARRYTVDFVSEKKNATDRRKPVRPTSEH